MLTAGIPVSAQRVTVNIERPPAPRQNGDVPGMIGRARAVAGSQNQQASCQPSFELRVAIAEALIADASIGNLS
jgi:hypothetical protein